jgi:uncharacterized protein YuzE
MQLTYDPRYNIAYLRLQEKGADVESIRLTDALVVDMAPDGTIYGIELLNANDQLRGDAIGELVVINEATGERAAVPLAGSGTP